MNRLENYLRQFEASTIYWIVIVLLLLLLAFAVWFFRGRAERDTRLMIELLDWFEVQGMGAVLSVFSLFSVFLLIWAGWRIPTEIGRIFDQTSGGLFFPIIDGSAIGRIAQITGAGVFAWIAFRGLRFFLPVFLGLAVAAIAIWVISYIWGVNVLSGF